MLQRFVTGSSAPPRWRRSSSISNGSVSPSRRPTSAKTSGSPPRSSGSPSPSLWAYAFGQVPTGWFSDRYGPRRMMVVYLVTWSLFGILMALATDFWTLIAARLALGLFQAGAYPTLAILVKRWAPESFRATANSLVAFGGRFGGAGANLLTAWLIVWCVPMTTPAEIDPRGVLDPTKLVKEVIDEDPSKSKNLLRPILAERLRSEFPGDSLARLRSAGGCRGRLPGRRDRDP
ncbi:MAG: MFS transporter [Rubrivivax sp.]